MKTKIPNKASNFFQENQDLIIAGSTILLLAGAGYTWYYFKNKKEHLKVNKLPSDTFDLSLAAPVAPQPDRNSIISSTINNSIYPIKYGSRSPEVKILQSYLKIYKENLGSSGSKKDGVDGVFGSKTASAAKKRLGKAVFLKSDIDGMRKTLKSMGKI